MSKSKVTDPLIREELKIYSKEDRTNSQEIYKTKGMRTQVESVYEHLKGYRAAKMINSGKAVIVHKNKNKS
jgi:hypothetical protein